MGLILNTNSKKKFNKFIVNVIVKNPHSISICKGPGKRSNSFYPIEIQLRQQSNKTLHRLQNY